MADHKNIMMINNPGMKIVKGIGTKAEDEKVHLIMTKIVCAISIATCSLRLPSF